MHSTCTSYACCSVAKRRVAVFSWVMDVTFIPRAPQKSPQNDDTTKAADLKRRARDIARDSHGMEDQIRAMVSSYMAPDEDDEDLELMIGRLVC